MKPDSPCSLAVTGVGALLPTGIGPQALWQAWCNQQPGFSSFSTRWLQSRLIPRYGHIAAEHEEQARQLVPHKLRRYASQSTLWGVHAAQQAMTSAGLEPTETPSERRGLFTAQADYSNPSLQGFQRVIAAGQDEYGFDLYRATQEAFLRRGVDPFIAIKSLANNQLALLSLTYHFKGAGGAFVQNESACLAALDAARFSLEQRECDWALVVSSGSYLCPLTLKALYQSGELSTHSTADALHSFDPSQSGTVLANGAIALVLERADHALARGAQIQCFIRGLGSHSPVQAGKYEAKGYYHAIQRTGIEPAQMNTDAILITGHGGHHQDEAELSALRQLPEVNSTPVTTVRPVVGSVAGCGPLIDVVLAKNIFAENYLPAIPFLSQTNAAHPALLTQGLSKPLKRLLCLHQGRTGFCSAIELTHPLSSENMR